MTRSLLFISLSIIFLASCTNREYKEGMTATSFTETTIFTLDGSEIPLKPEGMEDASTIVLVRHAEKDNDGTDNPGLTGEGEARAERLASMIIPMNLKEVFMTNKKRVIFTAKPLAMDNPSIATSIYSPEEYNRVVEKIFSKRMGESVVIYGHSNTTPELINLITGNTDLQNIPENEYDNIYVVNSMGEGAESVVWKFKF